MGLLHRVLLLAAAVAAPLLAQGDTDRFDRAIEVLNERFFDRAFVANDLPALVLRYRPAAAAAGSPSESRAVVHALLAELPASHLAMLSSATHRRLEAELMGQRTPMLGCALVAVGGRFFVDATYEGGAAAAAGLRDGDEVLAIDGVSPGRSPLLDWRSDDAHLPDPPTHDLVVAENQSVAITIGASDGPREVVVTAAAWSALAASVASARVIEIEGHRLLYVHLWFVFHSRAGRLVESVLRDHDEGAGLVLDLRGRGGSALECAAIVRAVADAGERGVPTVCLIDGRTRSAKEVVASDLKRRGLALLVGERTAGAVLPASFVALDDSAVLMLPEHRLGAQSDRIEGRGVEPDLRVAAPLPPVPGADPILQAGLQALADILRAPSGR